MNIQLKAKRQDGFTIIELVVVILLLGILAATALPRFMDVTDEAHDAVVEGVVGGLNTGAALFRATWVATGQDTSAAVDYPDDNGALFANTSGYPIGEAATITGDACQEIFTGLLQAGGLPVVEAMTEQADNATDATIETEIETAAAATEFAAINIYDNTGDVTDTTSCNYYYVGQFSEGDATTSNDIPYITFNLTTGTATISATEFPLENN